MSCTSFEVDQCSGQVLAPQSMDAPLAVTHTLDQENGQPLRSSAPGTHAHSICRSRLSLLGAFCAMLAIGSVYGWGTIANQVGKYGYSPDDKLIMGTIGSLSVYITFHTGIFFDVYGARASLLLGGVLAVVGWLLTLWGITNSHSAILVGIYQCFCGQAVQPVMLAALESVRNFPPEQKGIYSAIALTGFGLTSTIMALMTKFIFKDNLPGFLVTMAISSAVLIVFQFIVFAAPPRAQIAAGSAAAGSAHFKDMLRSLKTHLFLFIMVCFGMELFFFTVNVVNLNKASGYEVADLLTAFSLCNVLARPVVGLSSDWVPLSRAHLLAIGSFLCAGGMFCLLGNLAFSGAILVGLSDGFMFAVWVPLTREVHGNANYGITFSTYLLTLGVGNVITNFGLLHFIGLSLNHTSAVCAVLMLVSVAAALFLHALLMRDRTCSQ